MPTLLLVRHGRTGANAAGVLAGRTPGVALDDRGRAQAAELGDRMAGLPLAAVVTSPLQRCLETARALLATRDGELQQVDDRLTECEYGAWTGRTLKELAREPLWKVVQGQPSAVRFPGGESLRGVQARAVEAVRDHDARVAAAAGPDAVWVAVSHGDVIKSVVADALGVHLDQFQRVVVDPCSVSVIRYTDQRPFVVRLNDTGGDLAGLRPPARRRRRRPATGDAPVGGGAGTA
ncbi:MAG TPA: histidine phosphatase family protein [Jiangellales bacterium]|nr:histidine phosphatase family protein [Jiangellales bacterium]